MGDDLAKEAPLLVRGAAKDAIHRILEADLNKDGHGDVLQLINFAEKTVPLLVLLDAAIDFEDLGDFAADLPFIKDKEKFAIAVKELGALAEHAGKLLPH